MKKIFVAILSSVLFLSSLAISGGSLKVSAAGNKEELVNVTIYSDENQLIMTQVPKSYEQEYLSKLKDPAFKNAEIQKSLGVNMGTEQPLATAAVSSLLSEQSLATIAATTPKPTVYYLKKAQVIKTLKSLDSSRDWGTILSNPLTDGVVAIVTKALGKSNFLAAIATATTWATGWVQLKQKSWWQTTYMMILEKKITGVKLTVTPNNKTEYPKAYITLARY